MNLSAIFLKKCSRDKEKSFKLAIKDQEILIIQISKFIKIEKLENFDTFNFLKMG